MTNKEKCPFLEEVVMRYCKAYPIKKMIPMNSLLREDPCIGCPHECSIYQEMALVSPCKDKAISPKPVRAEFTCYEKNNQTEKVRGFSFHPSVYYLPNHIWIKVEAGNDIKLGLDDFALKLLGEISQILLSRQGDTLSRISIKHRGQVLDIPVLLSGKVVKSNQAVLSKPDKIGQDPYKNWLYTIEKTNVLDNLKDTRKGNEAKKWLEKEVDSLQQMLHQECGITVADGGELITDIKDKITDKIIKKFLKLEE